MAAADVTGAPITDVIATQVTATTPSGTDGAIDELGTAATVTGAELGDVVLAAPTTALPTNQHLIGAYVTANNTVQLAFGAVGSVTGASRVFNVIVIKRNAAS